jgi:quinol monooxygenase YgiN
MDERPDDGQPVVSLIEWHASRLQPDDARQVAAETAEAFARIPGMLEIRFLGDFETGRHYYVQTWRDRAALEAYMASESMFRIRDIAAQWVDGRPERQILVDYSPRSTPPHR